MAVTFNKHLLDKFTVKFFLKEKIDYIEGNRFEKIKECKIITHITFENQATY
jgi:hypothetical protein